MCICSNGCRGKKCKFYSYFYASTNPSPYDKGKLHEMCFYNDKPATIFNRKTHDCPLNSTSGRNDEFIDINRLINEIHEMLAKNDYNITPAILEKSRLLQYQMHGLIYMYAPVRAEIRHLPMWKKVETLCNHINKIRELKGDQDEN